MLILLRFYLQYANVDIGDFRVSSISTFLFAFIYLNGRVTEKGEEYRGRFHPLGHFPDS